MKLKYLVFIPAVLFLAACDQPNAPKEVGLGEVFEIAVGQSADIRGEGLGVAFGSVPEDSRCPTDVDCIWGGNARVVLRLQKKSQSGSLELNTSVEPRQGDFLEYRIRLVDLKPVPVSEKPTPPDGYTAVLVVSKR